MDVGVVLRMQRLYCLDGKAIQTRIKYTNYWLHNSFLSLLFLSGPTFDSVFKEVYGKQMPDAARCGLSTEVKRGEGSLRAQEGVMANHWKALSRGARGALFNPPMVFQSGCSQIFRTRCFHLTPPQLMRMRRSCEAVMSPERLCPQLLLF